MFHHDPGLPRGLGSLDSVGDIMTAAKMPLSAVGMIAANLFIERAKRADMTPADLDSLAYGPGSARKKAYRGTDKTWTYAEVFAHESAELAWKIAKAVDDTAPQD